MSRRTNTELEKLARQMIAEGRADVIGQPTIANIPHPGGRVLKMGRERRADGYRSQLEADYAAHLDTLEAAGRILEWRYEPIRLLAGGGIGKRMWFTPDFLVETTAGVEMHETKGFRKDAGMARLRAAAAMHPWFRFRLVEKKRGEWKISEVRT